jgi:hypothetical protein
VPIEDSVYGYNQVDITCSAYLNKNIFDLVPFRPSKRHAYGYVVFIVSYVEGTVLEFNKHTLSEIRNMSSYYGIEMFVDVGGCVKKTIDCFTWIGNIQLTNKSLDLLQNDVDRIRNMELNNEFFILE